MLLLTGVIALALQAPPPPLEGERKLRKHLMGFLHKYQLAREGFIIPMSIV